MRLPRVLLSLLAAVGLTAAPLPATWTILIVDLRTGELAIGSASCLLGIDLRTVVPIVLVGRGVAVAQGYEDPTGANELLIRGELLRGSPPSHILQLLGQRDPQHQYRQYAIVDAAGQVGTFTGSNLLPATGTLTGTIGSLSYVILGNLLAGPAVLTESERALRNSTGTVAERLMAAMEAARAMGGDGRCSCDPRSPTRCGTPPPSFTRSATSGFMIVTRVGDVDGPCDPVGGCAQGNYYLNLNVVGSDPNGPDPVDQLRIAFDSWRLVTKPRVDHHLSSVVVEGSGLPADGRTTALGRVVLRNLEGSMFTDFARVFVTPHWTSTAPVTIGPITDHRDGTYTFPMRAGTTTGDARLWVVVDDTNGSPILISPQITVPVHQDTLWVSRTELSASVGGTLDFVYRPGAGRALSGWWLVASASGTTPGVPLGGGLVLPLNPDAVLFTTIEAAVLGYPPLSGVVPADAYVQTRFTLPAGSYGLPAGVDLHFAALATQPFGAISNPVGVRVVQ